MNSRLLIQHYLLGIASEEEIAQLNHQLAHDRELRREFLIAVNTDAALRETAFERNVEPIEDQRNLNAANQKLGINRLWIVGLSIALAASLLLSIGPWFSRPRLSRSPSVATLLSSENAAWESVLPTTPGSELDAGLLSLKAGVATIRFRSGTEVVLEAPAELELVDPMRGRLLSGVAVIDVPEPAIGFVMETPDGYAVDFGTQFSVRVDQLQKRSDFEVIEGEIAVHHSQSGDQVHLVGEGKTATISDRSLVVSDLAQLEETLMQPENVVRIGTNGRWGSALRTDKRKHINPEVLSVKRTQNGKWDHRSFFSFDLSNVDLDSVSAARLRLNLVASQRGHVARLPRINRFGVYGLTNPAKANWTTDTLWEDAPGPEDGIWLGSFEIQRSQNRGNFGIQNEELLEFLRSNRGGVVTFILVRETTQVEGVGPGMIHNFASDSHPESVGPILEFSLAHSMAKQSLIQNDTQ